MTSLHLVDDLVSDRNWTSPARNVHRCLDAAGEAPPIGAMRQGRIQILQMGPFERHARGDTGGFVPVTVWGSHIFIGPWDLQDHMPGPKDARGRDTQRVQVQVVQDDQPFPVQFKVISPATTRMVPRRAWNSRTAKYDESMALDSPNHDGSGPPPYAYLDIQFTGPDGDEVSGTFKFQQSCYGTAILDPDGGPTVTITSDLHGMVRTWTESLKFEMSSTEEISGDYWNRRVHDVKTVNDPIKVLHHHLGYSNCPDGAAEWWNRIVSLNPGLCDLAEAADKGLSILKRKDVAPVIERLRCESPTDWFMFQWLRDSRTKDKRCNNNLLANMLAEVGTDFDKLKAALAEARAALPKVGLDGLSNWHAVANWEKNAKREDFWFAARRAVCLTLPGAKERTEALDAMADATKQRDLTKAADILEIDEAQFPLLRKDVIAGFIPVAVFSQPDKSPVNLEFELWEQALARPGWAPVLHEISKDAARRGTYERDIAPYLAFMFRIEQYLDKHAPAKGKAKGWKAMPKYVQSSAELELTEADGATVKRRSAFTPVADNETRTVTVPYVAVCVSGAVTQWCYARHYHVFEKGMTDPISLGIVPKDLEIKLNGRDDYGLCFYTLTGTATATGYPTFLIIFERLTDKTRVHFHRVRPCRSKDGIKTPACKLIQACYQYMAGNVPAQEIVVQQGDLMFMHCADDPIKAGSKVAAAPETGTQFEFESHQFRTRMDTEKLTLHVSTAKTPANRLGFVHAPGGLAVHHPEHQDIETLPPGWWEVRRAKSFEANPVTIWSRTID